MNKSILSIILFCVISFSNNLFAQCTPDPNLTSTATLPAALDTAVAGELYTQEIKYFITKDTNVFVPQLGTTLNATIDTLWITDVKGMPDGFTYSCHNADCKILGGTAGCATLTGTPTQAQVGIYPLMVLITVRATAFLGPVPISQNASDTNARYSIVVSGLSSKPEISILGGPILFPNPAKEELQVYVPELSGEAQFVIQNIQGKTMQTGRLMKHEVSHVSLEGFEAGVYIIRIHKGNEIVSKKFVVE
ncbi:MAG: T9SS type A sorting domain-containing protein [Bacteroidia bacterium]|nr:T9SS type A sorting domain-containing protein [Bacteroidia bacterium]